MKQYHYSDGNVAAVAAIAGTVLLVGILGAVLYVSYSTSDAPTTSDTAASSETQTMLSYSLPDDWTVNTTAEMPTKTEEDSAVLITNSDFERGAVDTWTGHAMTISVSPSPEDIVSLEDSLTQDEEHEVIILGDQLSGTHTDEAWQYSYVYEGTPYHGVALRFGTTDVHVKYYVDPSDISGLQTIEEQLANETQYMDVFIELARSVNYGE